MSNTIAVNVNGHVHVKLTDAGKAYLESFKLQQSRRLVNLGLPVHEAAKITGAYDGEIVKEGFDLWYKWQLWELMQIFGPAMSMGLPPPFETTIRIVAPHIDVVARDF